MITLIVLASIAVLIGAGWWYEKRGELADAARFPPPGRLVDLGGRRLHLLHKGPSRRPTVVIEQGAGCPSLFWWPIVDRIAEFASVCAYDRAGIGSSDAPLRPHSPQRSADDLHALLAGAGVPGPYVLVGHSYGGLVVRTFARDHREDVAGLVLVDTLEEHAFFRPDVLKFYSRFCLLLRLLTFAAHVGVFRLFGKLSPADEPKLPPDVQARMAAAAQSPGFFHGMRVDFEALSRLDPLQREPGAPGSLGDLPLIVITHGQPFPGGLAVVERSWGAGQQRLAKLSSDSELIVATDANHMIQLDSPDVVLDAVRRVLEAATTGKPLHAAAPKAARAL